MPGINEIVLKVAARCNINCDYCYEFNRGDESWRTAERLISSNTVRQLGKRIAEHATANSIDRVIISLHGGEPLLLGHKRLNQLAEILWQEVGNAAQLHLTMQTNAMLLSKSIAQVIARHDISVGVSLDGPERINDRHRLTHKNLSSYRRTITGIENLKEVAPQLLTGLLAVIDIENDPLELLDFFGGTGVNYIDFILPHYCWDQPPPRPNLSPTAYAEWYLKVYEAWLGGRQSHLRIRFLEQLIRQTAGGRSSYEQNSLAPVTLIIVNSSGEYEAVDAIKGTAPGKQFLGLNIREHSIDDVVSHPMICARMNGLQSLCSECQQCDHVSVCAGGYFPHRWGLGRGFDNPTVYCTDMYHLIHHISEDLTRRKRAKA